jgi:PAS domain S-box-containing protein
MDDRTSQEATPNRAASAPAAASSHTFDPRDLIPTPLFCATPDGRLVWMNAAAEALTGRHAAAVAGEAFSVLFPGETRLRAARHVLRQRRRGRTEFYFETPILTGGVESHWVGLHVRLATAANGRTAYVCAAHDLHEIHADLEALTRRNRELTARLEEATAGAELKSTFLATMSSELRAPMNGVIGMSRLLLDSGLDRDQRTWAEVIQSSGNQLLELVDDILDYSRIESGQLAIGSMDFDLRVTVDAVSSLLATRAHDAGIAFSSLVHHRVPSLLDGDPGRVRQVLLHLADCALEQAAGGELQLRVELVEETAHQAVVRFWVNRIGGPLGGDPATEANLIALYGGEAVSGEGGGQRLGGRALGLTIARRLVALMGGDSGASRAGEWGSKLWFRIPLGKQAERPASVPMPAAGVPAEAAGRRVLVVDADAAARAATCEAVASWGGGCDQAEGGLEAIERLQAEAGLGRPYDAVLVDLEVADLEAEAFARAVRSEAALAALPLVLVTAFGRPGDAARAEGWGYDAYFVKPLDAVELKAALAELATRRGSQRGRLVTRHTVAELRKRRVHVLVVEDNPIDQLVIASALRRVGYMPEMAQTVDDAADAMARHAADVVFVDVAAAGEEGYARAADLRAACDAVSDPGPRIPIIALVGRVRDEEKQRCSEAGVDDLLGKPVDLEALVATVDRWVESRGQESESAPAAEAVEALPAPEAAPPSPACAVAAEAEPAPEPLIITRSEWIEPVPAHAESVEEVPTPPAWAAPADPDVPAAGAPAPAEEMPAATADEAAAAAGPDALPVLDATSLDAASMGNAEIRGLLVEAFLTRTRQPFDRLKKAAEWKDVRAVEFQAHALRSMCQSVGAARCAAAVGRVEERAVAGDLDAAIEALGSIEHELAAVRAACAADAAGRPSAGPGNLAEAA